MQRKSHDGIGPRTWNLILVLVSVVVGSIPVCYDVSEFLVRAHYAVKDHLSFVEVNYNRFLVLDETIHDLNL